MADNKSSVKYEETVRPEDEELVEQETDEEEEEDEEEWDDWNEEEEGGNDSSSIIKCLFCDYAFDHSRSLFDHCISIHHFDFPTIRRSLSLDFYSSFNLFNYIRSLVAENRCWSCGLTCQSNLDLQSHLHEPLSLEEIKPRWNIEAYLKPFLQDDPLLYSFTEDDDEDIAEKDDDDDNDNELTTIVRNCEEIRIDHEIYSETENVASASDNHYEMISSSAESGIDCPGDKKSRAYFRRHVAKDVKNANEDYFGSYSSFGIHKEMLSDKVRMDAYRQAILDNPSLISGAVVMDVGCGTGILSLFAAQAGASRVIAVEASEKMAAVATEIARENGLLRGKSSSDGTSKCIGLVEVVQCMVEEVDKKIRIEPHTVDVLLSEWMGYCLLYESMLSSVLFARDRWLRPGGAMLPDTATIFAAGFGKGGTSLPFWENVYGFNMSCIGKELVGDAARIPIVDTVEGHDLVTNAAVLKTFDLVTMRPEEVDFTASIVLEPSLSNAESSLLDLESKTSWCYGVVLWFETGFTGRFCKEMPAVLSTSPHTPKTHWSQTILTFREPIAIAAGKSDVHRSAAIGTDGCPATNISLRISIVRASQHRSIDISMETSGVGPDGRKRSWPVQLFNL
ncbi:probable protein arginine N-methyltransferase 3 [Morus notabilis]|uniref:probable protein arginine N-methyltransferase 3 n=1 Tax=Morus notabilis TaxID=981085 RepID=UPI000CECED8F|nr:probable protein arginine N-methyltransferase 3 [Morus notabilis]